MAGGFHFLAMVSLVLATLVVVARGFGRPTVRRAGAAGLVALASLVAGLLFVHACDSGVPITQWLVGAGCALAAVLFVRDPRSRALLAAGALLVMVGLCVHYTVVVHDGAWIGNPASFTLDAPAQEQWHTWLTRLWAR